MFLYIKISESYKGKWLVCVVRIGVIRFISYHTTVLLVVQLLASFLFEFKLPKKEGRVE
jgi:hypothetical protein